mmetsp:Transcript_41585/g.82030  ORF Transcript_41585/g.82030 Transcript_41585/m.82030 type:complete len:204 (-) Transcript_41585:2591-3202(-)
MEVKCPSLRPSFLPSVSLFLSRPVTVFLFLLRYPPLSACRAAGKGALFSLSPFSSFFIIALLLFSCFFSLILPSFLAFLLFSFPSFSLSFLPPFLSSFLCFFLAFFFFCSVRLSVLSVRPWSSFLSEMRSRLRGREQMKEGLSLLSIHPVIHLCPLCLFNSSSLLSFLSGGGGAQPSMEALPPVFSSSSSCMDFCMRFACLLG